MGAIMSRTKRHLFLITSLALTASASGVATPVSAGDPAACQRYASAAVFFQQQNTELGCGFVGPAWNADLAHHYNWCMSNPNAETAGDWTTWREQQIAQCRNTQAAANILKVMPQLGGGIEQNPGKANPPSTPLQVMPDAAIVPSPQQAQPAPQFEMLPDAAITPPAQQAQPAPRFEMLPDAAIVPPPQTAQPGPRFEVMPDAAIIPPAQQGKPGPRFEIIPDAAIVPPPQTAQPGPRFEVIPDAAIVPPTQQTQPGPRFEIIPDTAPDTAIVPPGERRQPGSESVSQIELNRYTQAALAKLNREMVRTEAMVQRSTRLRIHRRSEDAPIQPIDVSGIADRLQQRAALSKRNQIVQVLGDQLQLSPPENQNIGLKPQVTDLYYFPQSEALQPGTYVLIEGRGFGDTPGRVYLRYHSGSGELAESRTAHDVSLDPLNADWAAAWHDGVVIVRVPDQLPGQMMGGMRDAVLVLVKPDGPSVKLKIALQASSAPVVAMVTSDSGEIQCCCPIGTEYWSQLPQSHDYVYWPRPGRLDAPCGLDRQIWFEPGSKIVIHGKRFGTPVNGTAPGSITLQFHTESEPKDVAVQFDITSWSDDLIEAKVVSTPIRGFFATRPAWMILRSGDQTANAVEVAFGPAMASKWVSGRRWFKLDHDERGAVTETPNRKAMIVSHQPECSVWGDEGEEGNDRFFDVNTHPFPNDIRVTWFHFDQLDPSHPVDDWDVFGIDAEDLLSIFTDPTGPLRFAGKLAVVAFTLNNEGGYHAVPRLGPDDHFMGPGQSMGIWWKSSCEIGGGKPVLYTTSFLIEGPPEVLAKY
jgi:hypothetical protein